MSIYANGVTQNLYKQLLRASRQWRDLMNRMQTGLGHQQGEGYPLDGSMAIFCPACPQPGINLPQDWQERYNLYVFIKNVEYPTFNSLKQRNQLIRTFIMDGNFSAEHMRCRTRERDVPLSAGTAFMANPDSYKAHLRSGQESIQVYAIFLLCDSGLSFQ
jgi:hypothetical protein